jgi:hypothetical protein
MTDHHRRRLTIELEGPASEPSGWVAAPDGTRTTFDGWLQLLAALEHAIGTPPDSPATAPKTLG